MAIIVVGGSGRGAGKTALVCELLAMLPEFRWMAVKITSHSHGQVEPVWEEIAAGQGTDTARYLAAGAERAFLVTARAEELDVFRGFCDSGLMPDHPGRKNKNAARVGHPAASAVRENALEQAMYRLLQGQPQPHLIFESNSILRYLRPDLCLAVEGGSGTERKASFALAIEHADALLLHAEADRALLAGAGQKPVFRFAGGESGSPELLAWVRSRLLAAPHS